ncbi:MAG: hypothetical protein LLG02_03875 [Pelosinus sp.]|nr:hypothetical protein [Pelosinus sp.]
MKKIIFTVVLGIITISLMLFYYSQSAKDRIYIGSAYRSDQAKNYAQYIKTKKSLLVKLDKRGQILSTIEFDQDYSWATITPDGNKILCKADYFTMDWQSDYVIIDLITGDQHKSPATQLGIREHTILTNNMIGAAWFDTVDLYDMQYSPLNINLGFDLGKKLAINEDSFIYENFITGIEFDEKNQHFIVSWAQNMNHEEYFAINKLGISIFDYRGQLIAKKILPEQYMSPYSRNIRYIMPNQIKLLNSKWLLMEAMNKDYQPFMLLMNIENGEIHQYPYSLDHRLCQYSRIFKKDNKLYTSLDEKLDSNFSTLLVDISNGQAKILKTFPNQLVTAANNNPKKSEKFHPYDAVLDGKQGYIAASDEESSYSTNTGLFYWEKNKYTLIHQLPPSGYFNLISMDVEGNCLLLIW